MHNHRLRNPAGQRGLTLIELMVGVLLGMIAVLAITQVFANAEGYKRTTTSGSDAQVNGSLALFSLQRDIQMAGYGVAANPLALGCPLTGQVSGGNLPAGTVLAPVVITTTAGAPDQLLVMGSATSAASVPMQVTVAHTAAATAFTLQSTLGVQAGDLLAAVPPAWSSAAGCSLLVATDSAGTPMTATSLPHTTTTTVGAYAAGSTLVDLGTLAFRNYQISSSGPTRLQVMAIGSNLTAPTTTDLYPQVVMLRAFYGKDTSTGACPAPGLGTVANYDSVTPTTQAGWCRVLSIRIAVVVRSTQREKSVVTASTALSWDVGNAVPVAGSAACGTSQCVDITPPNPFANSAEWQHYRYKIYDTVIPLRNTLWSW